VSGQYPELAAKLVVTLALLPSRFPSLDAMSVATPPKALLTDVFGTVVDWRSSVVSYLTENAQKALDSPTRSIPSTARAAASAIDWGTMAQLWRETYYQFTRSYSPSSQPFKTVDQHHVEALQRLIQQHQLDGLWTDEEIQQISLIWHFLDPWPDSAAGLGALNDKFATATLSNGNKALLSDLASHGHLPYTHIISAEDFGAYKPHPSVYQGAAKKLGLEPGQCGMIAAHLADLKAAHDCGLQTIYIERPREEGWDREKVLQAKEDGWVDMWVQEGEAGFEEVARRFGLTQK